MDISYAGKVDVEKKLEKAIATGKVREHVIEIAFIALASGPGVWGRFGEGLESDNEKRHKLGSRKVSCRSSENVG